MKPYYKSDLVTLYHGDCMNVQPSYDLLVTDPPYGQQYVSGWGGSKWGEIAGDDNPAGVVEALRHALKGLKEHRHVYIFNGKLDLSSLPLGGRTELVWDKGMIGAGDLAKPWGPQHETITFATYISSKAGRTRGGGNLSARLRKGSVLRSLRPSSGRVKYHPTEKPVDILRQLIESSSVMGETVYDPFAGSGSTLVAAVLEGRKAIGCEIEERYCETAARRLEELETSGLLELVA